MMYSYNIPNWLSIPFSFIFSPDSLANTIFLCIQYVQTSISFIFHPDTSNCVHNLHQQQQKYIQNFTIYSTTLHIKEACFPQLFTRSTFQSSNGAMFSNALKLPFYSIHVFTVGNTTCTASLLSYKQKRKMLEAYVIVLRCNLSK